MSLFRLATLLVSCLVISHIARADAPTLKVESPWARPTVQGQQAGGAFMILSSDRDASLTGAESPAAERVEIHEMRHENGIMKMRPVERLDLPAGKKVELKPGGYHLMLMNLKQPLKAGEKLPITLKISSGGQPPAKITVEAEVRPVGIGPHAHH